MKIKWIEGERIVPGVGLLNTGDIREVSDEIGQNLIKQGKAIEYRKIPQTKKSTEFGGEDK